MIKTYNQSICFSGSGHHYPWQVGVALYLQENYDLSDCRFIGVSGGSFVAGMLAHDLSIKDFLATWVKDFYFYYGMNILGCYLITPKVIKVTSAKYMSEDDYERANNRLLVAVSEFNHFWFHNELISEFTSHSDMIDTLCASSHIPFTNTASLFYPFRGQRCLDGGLTWNWIKLDQNTLMISPYRWNRLKNSTYLLNGLFANTEKQYYTLVLQGYQDAKRNDSDFLKHGFIKKSCSKL